jgi:hypothetical protein
MRKRLLFIAPLAILGLLAFVALGGLVVQLLWNWLLPPLFGFPAITFWQGFGLLALCRILFGGFGVLGGPRRRARRRMDMRLDWMRQRMRDRWGAGPSTGAEDL